MARLIVMTILACLFVVATPLPAQPGAAPFTVEESGRGYGSLADAVAAIGGGSGTILIAPGRYRECAVQEAGRIAFVARRPGTVLFDGVVCEGKAALVLRGRSARVEGLVFQNLRVPDANGAGIRLEARRPRLSAIPCSATARTASSSPTTMTARSASSSRPFPASAAARRTRAARTPSTIAAPARSSSPARASSAAPAAIM